MAAAAGIKVTQLQQFLMMADVHRKIELQEQDDLRYLINNARHRASEKIDEALPPIQGEDALRKRVEELVHEYITATYTAASENIVINGLPPSPEFLASLLDSSSAGTAHQSEEYEPLDGKLHSRAAELYRREEDLLEEIAALKREVPRQAAANWREALKGGIELDEEASRNAERANDGQDVKLEIGKQERQEQVERTWGKGIEGLGRLKREMPGTTARMERAKRAADYVLADGKGAKG